MADSTSSSESVPPILYHYTNAAGLLGIIESQEQWATDIRFLNDSSEVDYATRQIRDRFGNAGPNDDVIGRLIFSFWTVSALFVACYCERANLLSQWRAYATEQGYAIALDLRGYAPPVKQVWYGTSYLDQWLESSAREVNEKILTVDDAAELVNLTSQIKHPSFSEECEWRIRILGGQSALRFRPSTIGVIPYIAIPMAHSRIKSVTVGPGPHQGLRAMGVTSLLRSHDLSAEVVRSEIPYRS